MGAWANLNGHLLNSHLPYEETKADFWSSPLRENHVVITTSHIKGKINPRSFKSGMNLINFGKGTRVSMPLAFEKAFFYRW